MSSPALIALTKLALRQFTASDLRANRLDFPALPNDTALVHSADNLPCVRQEIPPPQKFNPALQWIDLRFCVQLQTNVFDFLLDFAQRVFKDGTVVVYQDEIIHVPDIMAYPEPFFDVVV